MKRTNIEFIVDLMDFSSKGPIMQAFVITALQKYAEMVIEHPILDSAFLSSMPWTRCAEEVKAKIAVRLAG